MPHFGITEILSACFFIFIVLYSIVLHELGHAMAAYLQGDNTPKTEGRLTLNCFKHLTLFGSLIVPLLCYFLAGFIIGWAKPVHIEPQNLRSKKWGMALVALAGPGVNFLLALVFGLTLRFLSFDSAFLLVGSLEYLLKNTVVINLILAWFNLMPLPPLDGHHIVFACLSKKMQESIAPLIYSGMFFFISIILVLFYLFPLILNLSSWSFQLLTGQPMFPSLDLPKPPDIRSV